MAQHPPVCLQPLHTLPPTGSRSSPGASWSCTAHPPRVPPPDKAAPSWLDGPPGASGQVLTHPQLVDPLHQLLVLDGDLIGEVLVEAGLQGDEVGQRREVIFLSCSHRGGEWGVQAGG